MFRNKPSVFGSITNFIKGIGSYIWNNSDRIFLLLLLASNTENVNSQQSSSLPTIATNEPHHLLEKSSYCIIQNSLNFNLQYNLYDSDVSLYRSFEEYTNLEFIKTDTSCGYMFKGREKTSTRDSNPNYTNKWFIIYRSGLYAAQKEKAMAAFYRHFLGYAPDIDIIHIPVENNIPVENVLHFYEKGGNPSHYFIASREINNYVPWQKMEMDKYGKKPVHGLASIEVLAYFFSDSDFQYENYGYRIHQDELIAFKIDNGRALNLNWMLHPITAEALEQLEFKNALAPEGITIGDGNLPDYAPLPLSISQSIFFQTEKQAMLEKIANTDFSIIEKILRDHFTVGPVEEERYILNRVLHRDAKNMPEDTLKHYKKRLASIQDDTQSLNNLIRTIQTRQKQLFLSLNELNSKSITPEITQESSANIKLK